MNPLAARCSPVKNTSFSRRSLSDKALHPISVWGVVCGVVGVVCGMGWVVWGCGVVGGLTFFGCLTAVYIAQTRESVTELV